MAKSRRRLRVRNRVTWQAMMGRLTPKVGLDGPGALV